MHMQLSKEIDFSQSNDGGLEGVWGRAAQSRAQMLVFLCSDERLCGQHIPQPISLVTFLFGNKKVTPITEQNRAININLLKYRTSIF
jgi:hypothetical protein